MKKLNKVLIILTILALVLIPTVSCAGLQGATGAAGLAGPEGAEGPQGPQGPAGPARQIVVTCDYEDLDPWHNFAVVEAEPRQSIRIKGSGFSYRDIVTTSICENNIVLVEEVLANRCGAFEVYTQLPKSSVTGYGPVTLRAWLNAEISDDDEVTKGDLQATWPLDIVEELEI